MQRGASLSRMFHPRNAGMESGLVMLNLTERNKLAHAGSIVAIFAAPWVPRFHSASMVVAPFHAEVKQPLINDTIDLVQPMEFDRRRLTEVLHRRVERKGATGATGGRQQRLGIRCLMCVCPAYVCKHVL